MPVLPVLVLLVLLALLVAAVQACLLASGWATSDRTCGPERVLVWRRGITGSCSLWRGGRPWSGLADGSRGQPHDHQGPGAKQDGGRQSS
jgi:hypothetical protein